MKMSKVKLKRERGIKAMKLRMQKWEWGTLNAYMYAQGCMGCQKIGHKMRSYQMDGT